MHQGFDLMCHHIPHFVWNSGYRPKGKHKQSGPSTLRGCRHRALVLVGPLEAPFALPHAAQGAEGGPDRKQEVGGADLEASLTMARGLRGRRKPWKFCLGRRGSRFCRHRE